MKHIHLLITSLLLCTCCTLQAKNRVIDQPSFCVRNTTSIEVSKVVISDTATVLSIYAKYRPKNWIRIAAGSYLKDNNGETYQLRSGIGITPDKEFWMPESGEAEFQLVFPPLSGNATSFDFTEGEGVDGAFSIWGIQLKGNKLPNLVLPKEAVVSTINKKEPLPQPLIDYGIATLKGKFLEYHPGMPKQFILELMEPLKGYTENASFDLQPDGSFSIDFPVIGTTRASLFLFGTYVFCFVEPGKTTEIYVNLREISRQDSKYHKDEKPYGETAYINGPLAYIAQELNQYQYKIDNTSEKDYAKVMEEVALMDITAYKDYVLNQNKQQRKSIEQYPISQATKQLLILDNEFKTIQSLQIVANTLTQAYMLKSKANRDEANAYFQKLQQSVPEDYLPQDKVELMNMPQALLTSHYTNNIEMMRYSLHTPSKMLGTDKGFFFDLLCAATIYQSIKDFNLINDSLKATVVTLPAAYQQVLNKSNEQLKKTIEANKKKDGFIVNEAGDVSDEDLFASIISKFRGSVLLVDFWATWCGPCRMANKEIVPMKEELKNKDIVYLYITGETSPLKTWENMIPDIHGEHYRLTDAQWKYLRDRFKVEGVPTYLIIDREGNTKFKQTGFPGANKMKEELLKAL